MRAMTAEKNVVRIKKFMDKIELPIVNLCGHGDVKIATKETVAACCQKAGLKVEKLEIRKGMRMHCVVRKP